MKHTYIILLGLMIIASSCKEENRTEKVQELIAANDLKAIKELKTELTKEEKALATDIARLDSVISSKSANKGLPLISTLEVKEAKFLHYLELQGDVQTKQNVLVYPQMAGTIISISVTEGDKVSKGQVIARIDDGGMGNQLAQLKTQLALAKTTYERQKNLWDQEVGTEIQYLQAKANYEAQKEAVNQLQSTLDKYNVRAPFSGIVDKVFKETGTVVAPGPGSEIARVVNLSNMYVEVPVPETYIDNIKVGKRVNVYFPVLGDTITTKVRQTANFIDPANRTFNVEVAVANQNGRIKPNLTAKVQINDYTSENAILIPQSIISENAEGEQYVYLATQVDQNNVATASKKIIKTGKSQGDNIEVLSGIQAGQQVITEGARSVRDGQKIKILNN